MRTLATLLSLITVLLLTGCVQEETATELVLEADGSVTWIHRAWAVRSDAATPSERWDEEAAWLSGARSGGHPACRGLELLGAIDVRQDLLREEPPMEVRVTGRFESLESLGARVTAVLAVEGEQAVEREGSLIRWTLRLDPNQPSPGADDLPDEDQAALVALAGDDAPEVALALGCFVEARGFELSGDRRRATLGPLDSHGAEDEGVTLVLAWDPTR